MIYERYMPPFQPHSDTSLGAAVAILPDVGTLRRKVYDYLLRCGAYGSTDEEMQWGMAMDASTQRPRRVELVERHWVEDSGVRRKTRKGRQATVWVVKEA